ncbi:MAG: hypothetical protein WCV63_07605 [Negativicutes bacterium]|jgi:seryl-tRNA synthetase
MLDINFIINNTELVIANCRKRGCEADIYGLVQRAQRKNQLAREIDELRHQHNLYAKSGVNNPDIEVVRTEALKNKQQIKILEDELRECTLFLNEQLSVIPNMLDARVPEGGEENNVTLYEHGAIRKFDFQPKTHEQLGEILNLIDIPRGVKTAKTRFCCYKNEFVQLRWALARMFACLNTRTRI